MGILSQYAWSQNTDNKAGNNSQYSGPGWVPAPNQQFNMSVIARLALDGELSANPHDILAAFAGGECRGMASPISGGLIFLTVTSNTQSGESVSFKAWNSAAQSVVNISGAITFQNQGEIGTLDNPVIMSGCGSNWVAAVNQQYNMSIIGRLKINNTISLNGNNVVGAFVGNECRGMASPLSNGYLFLTVTSNTASGEKINFKVFNSDSCKSFDIGQTLTFQNQGETGTLDTPYVFSLSYDKNSSIGIGTVSAKGGDTVSVPVTAQNLNNITKLLLNIEYDTVKLKFMNIINVDDGIKNAASSAKNGRIVLNYSGNNPVSFANGKLFDLKFAVNYSSGGFSALTVDTAGSEILDNAAASVNPEYINGGVTITASAQYTINVSANPSDGGSVTGGGGYYDGQIVVVNAQPKTGYNFKRWSENGAGVSSQQTYSFTASGNRNLTAEFSAITITNPKGGETWASESAQDIKWSAVNVQAVKIEYSTNSGSQWFAIADSVSASKAVFSWKIPNTPSAQCKIRISDAANMGTSAVSNGLFAISSAANAIIVKLDTVSAAASDSVVIPMRVKNFNNVAAITLVIQFDTTKLSFGRGLNWNAQINGALVGNKQNKITIAWDNLTPVNISDDKLVDLKFFYKGGGQTGLNFVPAASEIADVEGNGLQVSYINGLILSGTAISGLVTYDNSSSTPLANVQVYLKADTAVVGQALTDANGAFQISNVPNGSYTITCASQNAWGGVNSTDALQVRRYIANLSVLTGLKLAAADVNVSGSINSTDALFIRRRIAGTISSFQSGDWIFENLPVEVTGSGITQNIKGICAGDINGSYLPSAKKANNSIILTRNSELSSANDGTIEIPVTADRDIKAGAITLALNYSSADYEITGVTSKAAGLLYSINSGRIKIAWDDINPLLFREGEAVVSLIAKRVDKAGTAAGIQLNAEPESEIADEQGKAIENLKLNAPALSTSKVEGYQMMQNYPNPFNPSTTIKYSLPVESRVEINISNTLGQVVKTLVNEIKAAGVYSIKFDAGNLPSGVYFYSIDAKSVDGSKTFKNVNKLILMK
jgi:hypothetical protein